MGIVRGVFARACFALATTAVGFQLACGSGGGNTPAPPAPTGLAYTANPAVYTKGSPIPANSPSSSGGAVSSYVVSPALPPGLSLNASSGIISGTPAALAAPSSYTVMGSNGGGNASVALSLTVNDAAPTGLTYSASTAMYTKGVAINPNTPSNSGGAVVSYTIASALPSGLLFNPSTGVISGTPTSIAGTASYTITATNTGGSATSLVTLTVNDVPPSNLAYSANPVTYLRGVPIAPNIPSGTGGSAILYSASPALPSGLFLNSATGVISGVPAVIAGSSNYTITASNSGGSASVDVSIKVMDAAPDALAYATNPATYLRGTAIVPNAPSNSGGAITSYSVSPALPAGLSLNSSTGLIFGVPGAITATASYSVTGSNNTGSSIAVLAITVNEPPPGGLTYLSNPAVYTKGKAISPNTPTSSGGTIASYTVAPVLPTGLALDPASGIITGTPTALAPVLTYIVTGLGTSGGTATASLSIVVKDVPPSITYGSGAFTFTTGVPVILNPENSGGPVVTWTLSPTLPTGLSFNTSNGTISGTPTVITPAAAYAITAVNSGGSSTVAPILKVNPPVPSITSQPSNATVFRGQQATFSVTATGTGSLIYQWQQNGTNIPGATTASFITPATVLADNSSVFRVMVTDTYGGSRTSSSATLTVKSGFTLTGSLITPREHHGAALLQSGKVLIVGGQGETAQGGGEALSSSELYDPSTGLFSTSGSMAEPRAVFTATKLANGKVLVVGGQISSSPISAELYDPATGTFSTTGRLNIERAGHTATLMSNGKVLLAGGFDGRTPPGVYLSSAEVYDPVTGQFSMTGSMATVRMTFESILLPNGKVLVTGGFDAVGGSLPVAELYDPAIGTWSPTTIAPIPRVLHQLALLTSGKVLNTSGQSFDGSIVYASELFDPASGAFSSTGSINIRRSMGRASVLPSGKVLLSGGFAGIWADDPRSDLFDPSTGTWALDAPINSIRMNHTATVLPGGKVLIVGGHSPILPIYAAISEVYQ